MKMHGVKMLENEKLFRPFWLNAKQVVRRAQPKERSNQNLGLWGFHISKLNSID